MHTHRHTSLQVTGRQEVTSVSCILYLVSLGIFALKVRLRMRMRILPVAVTRPAGYCAARQQRQPGPRIINSVWARSMCANDSSWMPGSCYGNWSFSRAPSTCPRVLYPCICVCVCGAYYLMSTQPQDSVGVGIRGASSGFCQSPTSKENENVARTFAYFHSP